jgi:hypothetical protein
MIARLLITPYPVINPMKGGKMGYYQNLQSELEEIHDDELREIVAWDHAHRHLLSAEERYSILTNGVLLKRALVLWSNGELLHPPKPAADHVALQEGDREMPTLKKTRICILGWFLIVIAFVAGVTIVLLSL